MNSDTMKKLAVRAINGRVLETLLAMSYEIDEQLDLLSLKAHFISCPNEDDQEEIMSVEGELLADFTDNYKVDTEFEVLSPSRKLHPLSQGFCYYRDPE